MEGVCDSYRYSSLTPQFQADSWMHGVFTAEIWYIQRFPNTSSRNPLVSEVTG